MAAGEGSSNAAVALDPSRTYQEMLVLDENGKPNIGPFNGLGFVTIHSKTKEITRSGEYWAMKRYTHAAQRGSKPFDTQGGPAGVAHVAFVNPDGTKTVVLSNVGAQRETQLRLVDLMTEVSLPANCVTNRELDLTGSNRAGGMYNRCWLRFA